MGKKEHITGIYTLIGALIGAVALFGSIYYAHILGNDDDEPEPISTPIIKNNPKEHEGKPVNNPTNTKVSIDKKGTKTKKKNTTSIIQTKTVENIKVDLIECKRGSGSVACKVLVTSMDKDERVCVSGGFAMVDNEGVNYGISNATNIGGKSPHFLGGEFCITLFDNAPMKGNIIYTGSSTADTAKVVIVGIGKKRFRYADIPIL